MPLLRALAFLGEAIVVAGSLLAVLAVPVILNAVLKTL